MDSETPKLFDLRLSGLLGYNAECRERMLARHSELLALLRARGIAVVRAHYDGCGDSGQLEACECFAVENTAADDQLTEAERGRIDDHFYDLLECRHGGWENNDGGYGDFTWTIQSDELTHDHNDYYTEVDNTLHEGLDDIAGKAGQGEPS
jgi:hypothetical protein